jgi:hypothetical protein
MDLPRRAFAMPEPGGDNSDVNMTPGPANPDVNKPSSDNVQRNLRAQEAHHPVPEAGLDADELASALAQVGDRGLQPTRVPRGTVSRSDALKAAMLQAGISLMNPGWGNGLSQLGQAIGAGAEAYTRAKNFPREQEGEELANQSAQSKIDLQNAQADYYGEVKGQTKAAARDRSTEYERLMSSLNIGPKGSAYFKTRMKEFGDPLSSDAEIPTQERFNKILLEAQGLDKVASAQPSGRVEGGQPVESVTATEAQPMAVGTVVDYNGVKYRFKGGDQYDKKNYEKVK